MRTNKLPNPELRIISAGLLLVTVPFLVNNWVPIPDFIRGILMGVGVGLEVVGLIRMTRRRRAGAAESK